MNPYETLLTYGHILEHCAEASLLLLLTVIIIVVMNKVSGGTLQTEIDYMMKNPRTVLLINIIVFLIYMIATHFAVKNTQVDLWEHGKIIELRDQWDREHGGGD